MNSLNINIPERTTKQLDMKQTGGKKKIVVSTNWLELFDFHAGSQVVETSLGRGKGIVVERVYDLFGPAEKTKKVYQRTYKHRKNNPLETLLEVASQKLISESFPATCTRVRVTFTTGKVYITPITKKQEQAIANAMSAEDRYSAFVACSSGVDMKSLNDNGFSVHSVVEYRPFEKRDKSDLTETGALNVLANIAGIKTLYNEDIYELDFSDIAQSVKESPYTLFHASPQCDDHSSLKTKKLKETSFDDATSTMDMIIPMIRIIEESTPPCVLLENVAGFVKSPAYELASLTLRRWGYKEHVLIGDARDYGGLTSRKRAYCFFTALPNEFKFESPVPRNEESIWPLLQKFIPECRDVTHSKALQDGKACGRLRTITPKSISSPTPVKSQERMAKDSLIIETDDNRFLWPSESMLKFVLGISPDFDLSSCSKTIASEIIGQSIDVPFHESVLRAIKSHIQCFFGLPSSKLKAA